MILYITLFTYDLFTNVGCDKMFFSEIMKEATDIAGCLSSRVRHLVQLHCTTGMQKCLLHFFQCFKNDQQALVLEGRMLIEYVVMNAIALRKILKKYDKVSYNIISFLRLQLFLILSSNIYL